MPFSFELLSVSDAKPHFWNAVGLQFGDLFVTLAEMKLVLIYYLECTIVVGCLSCIFVMGLLIVLISCLQQFNDLSGI